MGRLREVIASRVQAYEIAVANGHARYGKRGVGLSAVQAAAEACGLKYSRAIVDALRAAGHEDVRNAEARSRWRKISLQVAAGRKISADDERAALAARAGKLASGARVAQKVLNRSRKQEQQAEKARRKRAAKGLDVVGYDDARKVMSDSIVNIAFTEEPAEYVRRNMRAVPLRALWQRKQLDDVEFIIGDRVAATFACAEVGGAAAFDYARPCVDGGPPWVDAPVTMIEAQTLLKSMAALLGTERFNLLRMLCHENRSAEEAARRLRLPGRSEVEQAKEVRREARQALNTLRRGLWRDLRDVYGKVIVQAPACAAERRAPFVDAVEDAKERVKTARNEAALVAAQEALAQAQARLAETAPTKSVGPTVVIATVEAGESFLS